MNYLDVQMIVEDVMKKYYKHPSEISRNDKIDYLSQILEIPKHVAEYIIEIQLDVDTQKLLENLRQENE